MFSTYLLTIYAVLATPPGEPVMPLPDWCLPHLRGVAAQLEIADRRELALGLDLDTLRNRYQESPSCPPLVEALRLPPRDVVTANLQFACEYKNHLEHHVPVYSWHRERHAAALKAAEWHRDVWDRLDDAVRPDVYVWGRRVAMRRVRDLLGCADFYAGSWPPPAPIQYFREVR